MKIQPDVISVQMRLKQNTIKKVEKISKIFSSENRADAVRTSIDIADLVTKTIASGSRVMIYPPWWKFWKSPQRLIIPSLNQPQL
ncbi:MAG: hypothetical protein Q7S73_00040 [bacterium]|nr:hypothetical protein [bacterium]